MKTNKPKKYQYNCQLIDAWLTNQLPPEGGYYKGSSTHLECDATHFWAGEDQAFLLALKHRYFALLLSPVADIPFTGAVCDASRMVAASYTQTRDIRFLVPPEKRQKSYQLYNMEKRNPCGIPTLFVPHLCEDMVSASIESLLPAVYKYYDRAFKKHFAAKCGKSSHLLGYYDWKWNDKDKHTKAIARVKQTFNALSIPFKPEWDQMALMRTAKMRLAA